jgi:hypothetical protein
MRILSKPFIQIAGTAVAIAIGVFVAHAAPKAQMGSMHTSSKFSGAKANSGTVTHTQQGGKNLLTLSDDFKTPDTPDPHWQVVDSKGTVYQLDKLMLKGDRLNKTITLPTYINDVAKVVVWCAWAEANLGEATFSTPLKLK